MADKNITLNKRAGCGTIYLTVSEGDTPIVSLKGGKAGTCLHAQLTTIGYALTVALRHGATIEDMAEVFTDISCQQSMAMTKGPSSCGDAIGRLLRSYIKERDGK